ncbi:MAG: hypothetical protein EB084_08590 [Proteobacteria bacterium]|nr:hypothetical protein [Pseudomonadota bacterium]
MLDAFYGTQTPQSLPHAVLAQTFLDLEKSGARLDTRNASLNAYSAYQFLPSTPVTVKTHHRLTARTEDDLLFTGWLTNPSTPCTRWSRCRRRLAGCWRRRCCGRCSVPT